MTDARRNSLFVISLLINTVLCTYLDFDYIGYLDDMRNASIGNGGDGLFFRREAVTNSSKTIYYHRIQPKFAIVLPCCLPEDCYDNAESIIWKNTFGLPVYYDDYISQAQDRFGNILIRDSNYRELKVICEQVIDENSSATFEHSIRYMQLSVPNYKVNFTLAVKKAGNPSSTLEFECFDSPILSLLKTVFQKFLQEQCKEINYCLGPSIDAVFCNEFINTTLPTYVVEATFYLDWKEYFKALPFAFVGIREKLFLEVCDISNSIC